MVLSTTSDAATTLSAPAALSMLPASTSVLSPWLTELFQSLAQTGYLSLPPFTAISTATLGLYASSPAAPAAPAPPSPAAPVPPFVAAPALPSQAHVERLLKTKIISVQSDWGGEYQNLNSFFQKLGISHRVSCPYTHQQNGAAERKHCHIVETGLTLLAHASIPFLYWSDAFTISCFLIDPLPTRLLNMKTPLEL
jgi:hypothetical protein